MHRSKHIVRLMILGISAYAILTACSTPEPEGRFDEFGERTASERGGGGDGDMGGGVMEDITGTFFLALAINIDRSKPLFIQADITVSGSVIDGTLQPLLTDLTPGGDPRSDARAPVGDALTLSSATLAEDGTFSADLGEVTVNGQANPISFSDIVAIITLNARVDSSDFFCGTVSGSASQPIVLPSLQGSTFAAQRADAGDFNSITDIATQCPAATETPQ